MTSRDHFLKGVEGGGSTDPVEEFLGNDKDLDEVEGAVFEEITDDEDDLLLGGSEE